MKNKLKVGVVILTYNSEQFVGKCLKSVLKNDYRNFLCVVIDNNSTDQTINIVTKRYSKVKVIKNKSNLGYAAGNNIGIRYLLKSTNVSHVLILNPDTLVSPNLISNFIRVFLRGNDIGIIGSVITYVKNPDKIWFAGGYLNNILLYTRHKYINKKINTINYRGVLPSTPLRCIPLDTSVKNTSLDIRNTDFITGACMMVKREVFKKVGLLPEEYFMYFEDVDFCQNAIKSGYSCRIVLKPLVKHYVSASSGKLGSNDLTALRAYFYARNPFIYIKKNVKGWKKITNYLGQFLIRLPFYGLQIFLNGDIKSFNSYIKGVLDGLKYNK